MAHRGTVASWYKKCGRIGKASVRIDWDLNPIPPDSSVLRLFKYDQYIL